MKENTNKAIVINSLVLYVKMVLITIASLLTTRFSLQALGVDDFGLFSVLGGIISFISIFNTVMLSTSNRFLAVAIGKGNTEDINRVFNVNLSIFVAIAIIVILISYPIGDWYINNYINYNGLKENAMIVFLLSIAGSIISSIGIPYNGLLVAKEKFILFSIVEVICYIAKLIVAYLLISHFVNKLGIYAATMALMTAVPAIVYMVYCNLKFQELVKLRIVYDRSLYKEIFNFSGWVAFGAFASIAKGQGAALLVNGFFNTAMNTALGLANSINCYIGLFSQNAAQPMAPQITKSYAVGDTVRTNDLLVMSTKFTFLLMLLVSTPFFVGCEWIMHLWLGNVPPYAVSFTLILVIDSLVGSFNQGVSNVIFASGKIRTYQIVINVLRLLSLLVGYIVLKNGFPPEGLLLTYVCFSLVIVLTTQVILNRTLHFDNNVLIRKSYIPSLIVICICVPIYVFKFTDIPLLNIFIAMLWVLIAEVMFGFSKKERQYVMSKLSQRIK